MYNSYNSYKKLLFGMNASNITVLVCQTIEKKLLFGMNTSNITLLVCISKNRKKIIIL